MARTLVLKDGVLSAVVETFQQVELAQLEADHNAHTEHVTQVEAEIEASNVRLAEAQAAAEDSKSELDSAQGLVATSTDTPAGEFADESGSDVVHVAVENL